MRATVACGCRLLPRCKWGFHSCGMLNSVDWNLVTEVLGQHVGPICTRPANEPPSSQRYLGGLRWQGRYAKSVLQKRSSFIEVRPLNVHHSTFTLSHTARCLDTSWRCSVNDAFLVSLYNHVLPDNQSQAGVVWLLSQVAGENVPRHYVLACRYAENQGRNSRVSLTAVDCPMQNTIKNYSDTSANEWPC
jgi:hypothetical protein